MTRRSRTSSALPVASVCVLLTALLAAGCEAPPPQSKQQGYRGTGMVQVDNPLTDAEKLARNKVPAPQDPVKPGGPLATAEYKNIKVLTDVNSDEFTRLMLSITEWVAPEEGCGYCHNIEDLSLDTPKKVIARRMLQMTRHINSQWKAHVAETGVTCYTCHRGQPVPRYIWHSTPEGRRDGAIIGARNGQNAPAPGVGLTSLPNDPFTAFIEYANEIRVAGTTALPIRGNEKQSSTQGTEATYGLMMHMSQALGVNCTFCHNSRAFSSWEQSSPQRAIAWHGIRMARDLNSNYLIPLQSSYEPERLGPLGDAPKLNCATCHQEVSKPMNGASMLKDYQELSGRKR